jgi:hypothetical protein
MTTLICWTFHRGSQSLICAVEEISKASYEVCVLPSWNIEVATVEHFTDPGAAFRRHAEISLHLREGGWTTEHRATHHRMSPRGAAARRASAAI